MQNMQAFKKEELVVKHIGSEVVMERVVVVNDSHSFSIDIDKRLIQTIHF